jgi:Domain of unknown function DUF29
MRSRVGIDETTGRGQPRSLYDRDFAAWVEQQVELLRSRPAAGLDVENLTLELEGLTKRDERALGSQLKRVMVHLLKQRHQPERSTRSWEGSIANGREEIADILEQSPSLRRRLTGLMTKNYPRAIAQAARATRVPIGNFPETPPFTLAEVLGKER